MKTKHFFYCMAFVMMLLGTACTQEDDPTMGKVKVTFIAHLPETLDSRAIGDGSKANQLFFWVYDENDQEYTDLRRQNVDFDQTTNTSRVSAYLTPGHVYKFAFWAQHKQTTGYVPGASSLIQIIYQNAKCNDELRDAFWGWIPNLYVDVAGEITQDIVLTRRLAQLNVGISPRGYQAAKNAGVDLKEYDSWIEISNSTAAGYTGFELRTGEANTSRAYRVNPITFDFDAMPNELLYAENKNWVYLALNYFQPRVAQKALVDVVMKLRHKVTGNMLTFNFPGIPVRGTERTNILLEDIIEYVDFDVIIDENFDNLDNNIYVDQDGNQIPGPNGNGD